MLLDSDKFNTGKAQIGNLRVYTYVAKVAYSGYSKQIQVQIFKGKLNVRCQHD
jgi:hypothetical protein